MELSDDLRRLIQDNPIAHQCYTLHRRGDLSRDEMMERMVLSLAEENARLFAELKRRIEREPPDPTIFRRGA